MKHCFCLFLFPASVLLSCGEETEAYQDIPLESFRNEIEATPVRVGLSERRSFDYLINASGKVEAREQVKVVVERQGYLAELLVGEGDRVAAGQVLARLDNSESSFQLEKAEARLRDARVQYNSDILSFPGIMESGDTLQRAVIEEQIRSSSGLFMAEIELKEAWLAVEKSTIKAAVAGQVADLALKKGSLVNAGDALCEILSTNDLELKVKVLESDINFISKGQKAEVQSVSGTREEVTGTVGSINPRVDENGLVQVTLALGGAGGLLPGMNARAVIHSPQSNSIVVPKQAVVYRSGRPVVFTVEGNEARWNYVEVSMDNGREVEILDGILPDNTVILTNNLQLAHQAQVQIVKE